jgi:hypothetical protein
MANIIVDQGAVAKNATYFTFPGSSPIAAQSSCYRFPNLVTLLAPVAALGLLFQVGHFAEHAFQFAVWVLGDLSNICGRDTPWMSPWANDLVRQIGLLFFLR